MATRSVGSGTITFGLVTIPIKLYTATSPQRVSFNRVHKACGGRIAQVWICPTEGRIEIERSDTDPVYEHAKDQYVRFTDDELKELQAEKSGNLAIEEFVPASSFDNIHVAKTQFLGPDKGGARAYRLLAETLERKGVYGVGRFETRGKDDLVVVRPYKGGLMLHECFYANEVRSFEEVDTGGSFAFQDAERTLADALVDQLRKDAFEASRFHDTWAEKVVAAVQQKIAGEDVKLAPVPPKAQIVDLLEALKRSVAANEHALEGAEATRDELRAAAPPGPKGGPKKAAAPPREEPAPETVAAKSTVQAKGPKKARERKAEKKGEQKSG